MVGGPLGSSTEGRIVVDSQTKRRIRITAIVLALVAASVLGLFFYSVLGAGGGS